MNNIKINPLGNSIEELMLDCKANIEHAKQVAEYCEKLVSSIDGKLTNFTENEIKYLKAAALLHDIGYCIEKKAHHKHSMEIIIKRGINGFSKEETLIIANIARYHRASLPNKENHPFYAQLNSEDQKLVNKLASLLRMADGMDKPHKNLIIRLETKITEDEVVFFVKTIGFKPKLKSAQEKSDLFELTFNKKVTFIV